ncbi:MAG: lipopolysaccharide biosynthesis protein [Desulfomicrobium sp.]
MLNKLKKITRGRFVRNVAVVATGTAGAQAISMLFSPVITRIYSPESFGILSTFIAVLSIFTVIAAMTYPISIVLQVNDEDAVNICILSIVIAFSTAIITAVMFICYDDFIVSNFKLQSINDFLLLIPVSMLLASFQQILQQWLIRKRKFQITARVAVFQAFVLNVSKVVSGLFYPFGSVLIFLSTIGYGLHALLLWLGIKKTNLDNIMYSQSEKQQKTSTLIKSIKALAIRHRDFPLFRAPQVTINTLSQSLPILMLASYFGPSAAGYYSLGKSVIGLPSILIGKSVSDVFYPRITEALHNKESCYKLILKATLALASVGLIPFAVVIFFGPFLFSKAFGSEWSAAGEYARWLSLWMYFAFINRPSVSAIATLKLQGFFLVFEIVSVVVRFLSLYFGFIIYDSDLIGVICFSVMGSLLNLFLVLMTLYKSKDF